MALFQFYNSIINDAAVSNSAIWQTMTSAAITPLGAADAHIRIGANQLVRTEDCKNSMLLH